MEGLLSVSALSRVPLRPSAARAKFTDKSEGRKSCRKYLLHIRRPWGPGPRARQTRTTTSTNEDDTESYVYKYTNRYINKYINKSLSRISPFGPATRARLVDRKRNIRYTAPLGPRIHPPSQRYQHAYPWVRARFAPAEVKAHLAGQMTFPEPRPVQARTGRSG